MLLQYSKKGGGKTHETTDLLIQSQFLKKIMEITLGTAERHLKNNAIISHNHGLTKRNSYLIKVIHLTDEENEVDVEFWILVRLWNCPSQHRSGQVVQLWDEQDMVHCVKNWLNDRAQSIAVNGWYSNTKEMKVSHF